MEYMYQLCRGGDVGALRSMIQEHPELVSFFLDLLHHACRYGDLRIVHLLISELHWNPQCTTDTEYSLYFGWKKGDTPLHVACRYGFIEIVRHLIKTSRGSQAIPNVTTGELPLHIACYHRDRLELVKLVSSCDVNTKTKCLIHAHAMFKTELLASEGDTPLHVACRQSNRKLETVRYLCEEKHCDIKIPNTAGELPLHIACAHGQSRYVGKALDIVKLVSDCNVNTQTQEDKDTPLHVACRCSSLETVRYLCEEKHCDIKIPNTAGELPLHIACGRLRYDPQLQSLGIVKVVSDCNVNTQTREDKNTPLHVACRYSSLETVRYLCEEKHCDIKVPNTAGELPLHIACGRSRYDPQLQSLDIVKVVSDCNVNTQTREDKNTPLHIACRQRNFEITRYLSEEKDCDVNVQNAAGELPLHIACAHGQSWYALDIVKLVSDCNVNTQTQRNEDTPLHVACRERNLAIVRHLCKEKHCDANIQNAKGDLPLHIACAHGQSGYALDIVKLVSDCNVNTQTQGNEDTPLHVACRERNLAIVRHLCKEKHCDANIQNAKGDLPLHIACGMSRNDRQALDIVKLVSDCNVNSQTQQNEDTPLHVACRKSNLAIVRYLCKEKHCDANIQNAEGDLPLHIACGRSRSDGHALDIVKLVSDCNVNSQTQQNEDTPLHVACRKSNLAIVRYLCKEKHCDANIQNAEGDLPLHIACGRSRSDGQALDIVKLVSDCDVNTLRWQDNSTPLHIACRHKRIDIAKYLIYVKHCDLNVKDRDGKQPLHSTLWKDVFMLQLINEGSDTKDFLHWACRHGELDIVKLLIEKHNWDPNAQCEAKNMSCSEWKHEKGGTLLHVACRYGYTVKIVKYLTEHCDPTVANSNGELPLHLACAYNSLEIVKHVSNCDVNAKARHTGNTPLHIACERESAEIVKYLVEERQCDTTVRNSNGELSLHIACTHRSLEVVKLVSKFGRSQSDEQTIGITKLESDCNVNAQTWRDKSTPLHIACRHMQIDIAKYLVDVKHCDVNVKDRNGEQPLHITYRLIKDHVTLRKDDAKLVLMLINDGSDTNVLPDLLHWACRCGELHIVKLLVEKQDWDPIAQCQASSMSWEWEIVKGDTLLHVACRYGYMVKIVKYLIEHCDPTVRNTNGYLPLHLACAYNSLEIVKLVSNCDVNAKTSRTGNTPLHIACERGSAEIVKYLVEESHCDTTVRNSNGEFPLHIACSRQSLQVVKLVSNCDVNAKTSHTGNTPLHIAHQYGQKSIIRFLIEVKSCALTIRNNGGLLPGPNNELMQQERYQHSRSIKDYQAALRQKGALPIRLLKLLISGPPRVGKSSLKWRLVGKRIEIEFSPSTGVADAPIKVTIKRLGQSIAKACGSQWSQLSVDEQAAAILVPLLKSTGEIIVSEQKEQQALGSEKNETQAEQKQEGFMMYSTTSLESHNVSTSLNASTHPDTAPGRDCLLDSLHRAEYDEDHDIVTSNQSAASQLDIFRSVSTHNIATKYTGSDVQSGYSAPLQSSETPRQYKTEFVAANVKGVNRECVTSTELSTSPPQILCVEPTPKVKVAKPSMAHSVLDTPFPVDNIETTTEPLESDSKMSKTLQISESPRQYLEFVARNVKGDDREHVTPKELKRRPILDEEPAPRVKQTSIVHSIHDAPLPENIETTTELSESDSKSSSASQTLPTSEDEPLSMYPGFKDLGGLVSITLLQEGDDEKLKELLVNTTTIHIVDTGGQPEFHEILPALVTGPAVNLILFKLNEDLQERYIVEYLSRDGKSSEPYVTSYTNEDVIFQTLSTIACFSHHDSESIGASCVNAVDQEAVAVLVGTHMDQVSQEKETREKKIQEVDESLRHRIKRTEFYTDDLIKFFDPGSEQMIVPVDNTETCEDKAGITALREMLNKIFLERFDEVYVPPTWLIFDLVLRKSGAKTLNIHKCLKIAKLCGIESGEEFKQALWYLHHQVGVIMHFPEVPAVKDVVIVELQLLFDRITDVMVNTFTKERTSPFENELFKNKGQFLPKRVRSESRKKQDPLALDKLVKLLEYLHIVAHMVDHSDPSGKKNAYFMPCVLQSAEVGMVIHNPDTHPGQPAPLLIRFNCGFCPVGIFCAVVVYLLSEASSSEVKWQLSGEEPLHRNMITFKVGKAYDKVTLIARTTFYEIWLQRQMNTDVNAHKTLHEMCNYVRIQLHAAIQAVSTTLHYSYRSNHEFGFYCPQTACYKSQMAPRNHIAVCSYDNPSHMKCLVSDKPSPLPPMCAVWYGREVDLASLSMDESEGAKPIQQYQTAELRKIPIDSNPLEPTDINLANLERELHGVHKWFDLGLELGLSSSILQRIKLEHREDTSECLRDMLWSWLTEKDNVKAKGGANWETLVNALKSSKVEECKLAAQVSRNHRKMVRLASAQRPSTSPSSHTHLHPKSTPHSTSVHQPPQQQQQVTQDQRGRTTSQISDQVPKHPQVQQTAPQQGMSSLH